MTSHAYPNPELSPDRYQEQLQQATTTTRDLLRPIANGRWEIFAKASCTRLQQFSPGDIERSTQSEETGVAVRTYAHERAAFAAVSGLGARASRQAINGARRSEIALEHDPLPPRHLLGISVQPPQRRLAPNDWATEFCTTLQSSIRAQSGDRLSPHRIVVQEGAFGWILTTSDDFTARYENSETSVLVEVVQQDHDAGIWRETFRMAHPEEADPRSSADQIVNKVMLSKAKTTSRTGLKDVILHREVTAHVVSSLVPLLLATPGQDELLPAILNEAGQLTSGYLTIVDDRTAVDGPMSAPCDGEGLPARRTLLVEDDVPRHRLASYRDARLCDEEPRGGAQRISYRDYPTTGISNLIVTSAEAISPGDLLGRIDTGLYLLRPVAPLKLDFGRGEFRLLASGIWLDNGKITGWQPVAEISGGIPQLLRRIDAVATDLAWFETPTGFIKAPSLLVRRQSISE
jgi:PmbA protein